MAFFGLVGGALGFAVGALTFDTVAALDFAGFFAFEGEAANFLVGVFAFAATAALDFADVSDFALAAKSAL